MSTAEKMNDIAAAIAAVTTECVSEIFREEIRKVIIEERGNQLLSQTKAIEEFSLHSRYFKGVDSFKPSEEAHPKYQRKDVQEFIDNNKPKLKNDRS